ncbi:hypothetical protein LIPSTDRAFT_108553 [Lipomyces starkeyi NRRL Y-11557]|uniref:Inner kinetochore subunit AME1 domain-containing protein n=1 Tax=Lipomyces starkeyi NRRL Y-11557 TaxID=675824 RepID=A0A1E3QEZ7_LIPST|nr:hypothetical protein LIPSTDRAFT_108553 [Lipomyces starkeyi NRRL Y-11557]
MSAPTDRAARIASRIRGAGRTRYISNSSFAISLPRARTPKSGNRKKSPQSARRSKTPGSRRKASDRKTDAAAEPVASTSVSGPVSAVQSSGQVTVFARTPQYAKRSMPLRRVPDSTDGKSNKPRQPKTTALGNTATSPPQSDFEREDDDMSEYEHEPEPEDEEIANKKGKSLLEASEEGPSFRAEEEEDITYEDTDPENSPKDHEAYATCDSDTDPVYEAPKPAQSKPAYSTKRKAPLPTSAGDSKRKKQNSDDDAVAGIEDTQYVRIMTHRLPPRGSRGAPVLSDVDVVSQVISEQVSSSVNTQSRIFRRKVLEAYAEELEIRFSEMCDAVNAQGVLARATKKARRNVMELRDQLLALRKERRDIADEIVRIRAAHMKGNMEAKAENLVKEVLDAAAGVKSRASDIPAMGAEDDAIGDGPSAQRIGIMAELQKVVPLVCGHAGILGRLREFNSMLEQKEKELAVL